MISVLSNVECARLKSLILPPSHCFQRRCVSFRCRVPRSNKQGRVSHTCNVTNNQVREIETIRLVTNRRQGLLAGLLLLAGSHQLARVEAFAISNDDEIFAALDAAFTKMIPKNKAAALLRLVFHDAGTYSQISNLGGANASIQFELDRPENQGVNRGYRPLEKIKAMLKGTAAENVSMADLIAFGGAFAVRLTGGPAIRVKLGRQDATSPDPTDCLPAETLNADELKAHFANMGFSTQELVAISGAHTLGGKGFGDGQTFDNAYYTILLSKPWLAGKSKEDREMAMMIGLSSDKVLPEDEECLKWIKVYASDKKVFYQDFEKAYLKLSSLGAKFI